DCARTLKWFARLRIGFATNALIGGLSGCLLPVCLLKSFVCCVRVSNHVPCWCLWLAPRAAICGVGADLVWGRRLQWRHVDQALQPLQLSGRCHRHGAAVRLAAPSPDPGSSPRSGRAPRTSAIFPPCLSVVV